MLDSEKGKKRLAVKTPKDSRAVHPEEVPRGEKDQGDVHEPQKGLDHGQTFSAQH